MNLSYLQIQTNTELLVFFKEETNVILTNNEQVKGIVIKVAADMKVKFDKQDFHERRLLEWVRRNSKLEWGNSIPSNGYVMLSQCATSF